VLPAIWSPYVPYLSSKTRGKSPALHCIESLYKNYEVESLVFSSYRIQDDDSATDESSDEEDIFGISYLPGQNDSWHSDDSEIVFEDESTSDKNDKSMSDKLVDEDDDDSGGIVFSDKSFAEGKIVPVGNG
jgi:hypothetical protein